MDEADQAMQAELASQAGSVAHSDKMELEQEDANTVRDAEMEIHDIEAEGTIEDMKAAIALDDAEMNAEMQEQEHMQAERDYKDVDADVEVVSLDGPDDHQTNAAEEETTATPTPIEPPVSQDVEASEQLEEVNEAGNGITNSETGNVDVSTDKDPGQQTLEETLGSKVTETHDAAGVEQGEPIKPAPPAEDVAKDVPLVKSAFEAAQPAHEHYADA